MRMPRTHAIRKPREFSASISQTYVGAVGEKSGMKFTRSIKLGRPEAAMTKLMILLSSTFIFSSAAFAAQDTLSGDYTDLNCKPANPEMGCASITIDPNPTGKGASTASGTLSGGDLINRYSIIKKAIPTVDGPLYLLTIHSARDAGYDGNGNSAWIFFPKTQSLISVKDGLVLNRPRTH